VGVRPRGDRRYKKIKLHHYPARKVLATRVGVW